MPPWENIPTTEETNKQTKLTTTALFRSLLENPTRTVAILSQNKTDFWSHNFLLNTRSPTPVFSRDLSLKLPSLTLLTPTFSSSHCLHRQPEGRSGIWACRPAIFLREVWGRGGCRKSYTLWSSHSKPSVTSVSAHPWVEACTWVNSCFPQSLHVLSPEHSLTFLCSVLICFKWVFSLLLLVILQVIL